MKKIRIRIRTKASRNMDLLHGPLFMKLIMFALPLAMSSILQQLSVSVNVAVVGRFVGSQALAAVGSNVPVVNLLVNLFVGVSLGANAVISYHIGKNRSERIEQAVGTVALASVLSGLVLMVLGIGISRPLLMLINTPDSVLDMAVSYLRIVFLGIPFYLIFDFGAAILRSMGDTRRPLYILLLSGLVNVMLSLFLVAICRMGVEGVAIATSVSNGLSAAFMVFLLMHEKEPFRLKISNMRIHWKELRPVLKIGVPAGLQGVVFSFSNVVVQSAINSFGYGAVAGSAATLNFETYSYFFIAAFNGAAITFISQNYGAGKLSRVNRIYWMCMGLAALTCAMCNWMFVLNDRFFLSFFTSDSHVIYYGGIRMHHVVALQFIAASYEVSAAAMRGMGKSMTPTVITIFGTCVLRLAWVFLVLPHCNDFRHLMMVYPLSWVLTGIMMLVLYRIKWKKVTAL